MFSLRMELRKDPITRSWVITGDDVPDASPRTDSPCRFCADATTPLQVIASRTEVEGVPWSARSVVHPLPLYRIEGEPSRRGDGLYDRMRSIGAHEVLTVFRARQHHEQAYRVGGYDAFLDAVP